ncbi:MAG TPA: aminopeptidase [Polyangiaceae bacterium LLY-WYZ-15_(1-7)]|nr:aminopeptidase [Polyangiaceae bacterium LLY-WYZ-15_(1-7)]HJL31180.1 aminopeptidase [Polyangiaceae bacterium LLY-WYZ-15_(1-7)]HJL48463.1 aminopeptidase [Polyangiaceae bacterium LLY-WYZ-15_(1-7)]
MSQEAMSFLLGRSIDATLVPGALSAIEQALGLGVGQQLVLIVEAGCEEIGGALLRVAVDLGLRPHVYVVDRAQSELPAFLRRMELKLEEADGSILVGTTAGLDAGFRRHICTLPGRRRHAHMVGVTPEMMRQAMRADWTEVHQLGERLARQLRGTRTLHVQSGPREHLTVRPDGRCRWHNGSGQLREPGFTNLPGGEVVTCPGDVEGSFRADGGVWIGDRVLGRGSALTLRFAAGELVEVNGPEADALWEATEGPNGRRVGQLAFGTNTSVLTPIGAMLQDLKMPGLHLVLGYSCPEQTGASWSSEVMVPVLCRRPDVSADGQPILVRGRYAQQLMA